jgi:hypothetical protein
MSGFHKTSYDQLTFILKIRDAVDTKFQTIKLLICILIRYPALAIICKTSYELLTPVIKLVNFRSNCLNKG